MQQNKTINQLTFEKGMIENVKQESFGENLGSCLVLENWDNTLEIGSVIKRCGIGTLFDTFPKEDDMYNGNLLSRFRDEVWHDVSELVHATALGTANPQLNDTYVIIVNNNNYSEGRCRVIGFVPYWGTDKNSIDRYMVNWRNSLNPSDNFIKSH